MSIPNQSSDTPQNPIQQTSATAARKPARTWRRFAITMGGTLVSLLALVAVAVGGAEYWTSRPSFCGSCHIMDPYYESYTRDLHGAKVGVLCVDCHYAPGERFTIKAKFKGLSQVTSYFSGRYGAGRPRAHVDDDSCLRSGCHGDGAFRSKMLPIGEPRSEKRVVGGQEVEVHRAPTVHFFHEKHLDVAGKRNEAETQHAALLEKVRAALTPVALQRVLAEVQSVAGAAEREASISRALLELAVPTERHADVYALAAAEHRLTRLHQLEGLNCSSCHTFDESTTHHIRVDHEACFTCHFTNESFNRGTGECLRCHEAPARSILVHDRASANAASPILMDHQDVVRRGVDCASCHFDVVRGDTRVSERDCRHCHDQSHFLEGFATRNTETVRRYHEVHVRGQRARCNDCHRQVAHGLLDPKHIAGDAAFLQPVLDDCQHCHPQHHREQVSLLTGSGGAGLAHATPNAMMGSRLNCRACHTQPGEGAKGDVLIRATEQGCAACHGDEYTKLFQQWKSELDTYLAESTTRLAQLHKQVAGITLPPAAAEALASAQTNIALVQAAGPLHNRHYSLQLLDAARAQLDLVSQALPKPPQ